MGTKGTRAKCRTEGKRRCLYLLTTKKRKWALQDHEGNGGCYGKEHATEGNLPLGICTRNIIRKSEL